MGNYSSFCMHDIEQCGTFQHCPGSKLCLRPILTILQKYTNQKSCIFSRVWNDRLLRGDGPIGLVLAPTRELAMQIYAEAKKFGKVYDLQVNFYLKLFLWESIFIFLKKIRSSARTAAGPSGSSPRPSSEGRRSQWQRQVFFFSFFHL